MADIQPTANGENVNGNSATNGGRGRSASRSRSRSPVRGGFRSPRRSSPSYRRRSPPAARKPPHAPSAPPPSQVLGVFGLSIRTVESQLEDEFTRYGRVEKVTIVYDAKVTGRSRGFGFIRMASVEEAATCIEKLNGIELDGRRIRVDYSITDRPHAPTPGQYMGTRRDDRYRIVETATATAIVTPTEGTLTATGGTGTVSVIETGRTGGLLARGIATVPLPGVAEATPRALLVAPARVRPSAMKTVIEAEKMAAVE
ncbi:hypothetical protein FRB99_005536 [Tulasnella sp. 403]|nr:hypothetical protein FRB99_005536 [Tulasnella sp. 403]